MQIINLCWRNLQCDRTDWTFRWRGRLFIEPVRPCALCAVCMNTIQKNTSTATFGVQFTIRILRLLQGLNLNSTAPVCVRRWITFPRLNKGYKNLTFVPPTSRLRWHREMPRRTAEVCVLSDARCKFTLLSCVTCGFFLFYFIFYRLEMWLCRNVTASTSS